jgi:psp operon transcriptional activator
MDRKADFIGQSSAFLDAIERASRAAALNRPVLVIGERGTGKVCTTCLNAGMARLWR